MISILITIVIFLVVGYIIKLIVGQLGLPSGIVQIIYVIMGLIALIWLLDILGVYDGITFTRLN